MEAMTAIKEREIGYAIYFNLDSKKVVRKFSTGD